jgi:hypothetical protein
LAIFTWRGAKIEIEDHQKIYHKANENKSSQIGYGDQKS